MQFNLIAQLSAAPSSAPASSANDAPLEDKGFSKMLDDAGAKSGSEQGKKKLASNESKGAALTAQEVEQEQPAAVLPAEKASDLLSKPITPDEAKAMLAKLADGHHGDHRGDPAFEQLKEALEDIANGGEPTDLGSMLEALPEIAEAAPEERAPALQRLLGWVSAALDRKEAPAASTMPDGTVQSLQASLFSAGDDAAQRAAEAAAAQSDRDQKDAAAAAQAAGAVAVLVPTVQTTAMPEWVKKLGEGEENIAADAINEAIPPLALPEEEELLPVVNLPGSEDAIAVKTEPKFGARQFHDMLDGAVVANDNQHSADDVRAQAVTVDATAVVAAPATSSSSSANSPAPITVSAHNHLMPHLASAEQVHVAITTMKKEDITSITMQLEPADLGRVEIKMDTIDGRTHLSFVVDKAETLDALARDARSLERQLQESGIRADAGSMQFNLRQQPQQEHAEAEGGKGKRRDAGGVDEIASAEAAVTRHYTLNVKEGVDIHA